jgi:hypothetical protein
MSEEVSPFALTGKGIIDVQDEEVRDNINALLNGVTMKNSPTPYTALEHVKKVLANFHIFLPRTKFLEGDSGYDVWNINQFGEKVGMDDDGQFKSATQSPYFLYFEWQMCDNGTFKVFTEIVNQEELDELMSDVEDEFNESDDDDEEMNEAMLDMKNAKPAQMPIVKPEKRNTTSAPMPVVKPEKKRRFTPAPMPTMKNRNSTE